MNFADQEEIAERQKKRGKKRRNDVVWNSLTAIFLIASVAAVGYFLLLFSNPAAAMNPFPPPTLPALVQLPTSTPTLYVLPATWTPTVTSTSTPAPTVAEQTVTLPAGQTPTIIVPDSNAEYPFEPKSDPIPMANTVFHTNGNCNWQGVAGQVVDIQGRPIIGLMVHLQGYYNGKTIEQTTLTGGAQEWYGKSGYEFILSETTPIDSQGQLSVQLTDQSYMAVSKKVIFNTYSSCDKNLILINFQQVK
jgi:hypothetical protein